jgi:hypothetical protein
VVVIAVLFAAFTASIVLGLRMKLPPLGSSTPWADGVHVAVPPSYWWLFWVGQGCLVLVVVGAATGLAWLAVSFAVLFTATMVTRHVMAFVLIRRAKRRAGEGP